MNYPWLQWFSSSSFVFLIMPVKLSLGHLLVIEDTAEKRGFILNGSVYSIGRDPNCHICLVSQYVSRRHATLLRIPNDDGTHRYRIVDGDINGKRSTNGLIINGQKMQEHDLKNGDVIVFGPDVRVIYHLPHLYQDEVYIGSAADMGTEIEGVTTKVKDEASAPKGDAPEPIWGFTG